ncbi:putative nitroreductase [Gordonia sihwensis NBRC 108236]|uniref:Putative nitroreductase n=1 Tax=Gordonia sihwensis NBRC 108236 TaxID=1223544 RepID=L7LKZ3_9ACTN|nr:putative nitroreductase [Gordonia sihwensis NBRC 108236]
MQVCFCLHRSIITKPGTATLESPDEDGRVLEALLDSRWSCRGYQEGRQVPRADIERLLSIAQRSPSWCNTQPWQVIVTRGRGNGAIPRGSDRVGSAKQAMENFRLFGAPHVAIVTTDAVHDVYGAVDSGLYVSNFLLAARALGLGAIPQAALAMASPLIRSHFAIADDRKVLLGISFGYADPDQHLPHLACGAVGRGALGRRLREARMRPAHCAAAPASRSTGATLT